MVLPEFDDLVDRFDRSESSALALPYSLGVPPPLSLLEWMLLVGLSRESLASVDGQVGS